MVKSTVRAGVSYAESDEVTDADAEVRSLLVHGTRRKVGVGDWREKTKGLWFARVYALEGRPRCIGVLETENRTAGSDALLPFFQGATTPSPVAKRSLDEAAGALAIPVGRRELFDVRDVVAQKKQDTRPTTPPTAQTARSWIADLTGDEGFAVSQKYVSSSKAVSLFQAVVEAYERIGQITSVPVLRAAVARHEAHEKQLDALLHARSFVVRASTKSKDQSVVLKEQYADLKAKLAAKYSERIVAQMAAVNTTYETELHMHELCGQLLAPLKHVPDTLREFRHFIAASPAYDVTDRTFAALEDVLQAKFIVLRRDRYRAHQIAFSVECVFGSSLQPALPATASSLAPEFFVLLEYTGTRFALVTYRDASLHAALDELPSALVTILKDKCAEGLGGAFARLPGLVSPHVASTVTELTAATVFRTFDPAVVFCLHGRHMGAAAAAATKEPPPGYGPAECIPADMATLFSDLAAEPAWRALLSDDGRTPFLLHGHRWNSVQHALQAAKFRTTSPEFYLAFTAESGTDISVCPLVARAAGNMAKRVVVKGVPVRPLHVKADPDFQPRPFLRLALQEKFKQHNHLRLLLLATKRAKLTQYTRAHTPIPLEDLMMLREHLLTQSLTL